MQNPIWRKVTGCVNPAAIFRSSEFETIRDDRWGLRPPEFIRRFVRHRADICVLGIL